MISEYACLRAVRQYGLLALLGLVAFVSSIVFLHFAGDKVDWTRHYVSNLANRPRGWVFMGGSFVHGLGNLALTLGLRRALGPGRQRNWALGLLGLAAVGILLAALFPTDAPDQAASITGRVHRAAASAAFALELAALFVFSAAFGQHRRWQRKRTVSLLLSICAAVVLTVFVVAIQFDAAPGLAERIALVVFLVWEIWASFQLLTFRDTRS